MRTVLQILSGVVLGVFLLLFCMVNDDWVVIHLPSAPWNAEPSFPAFESRVYALLLAGFVTGILLCLCVAYFLGIRRKGQVTERDKKIGALELELKKANRLIARTVQSEGENSPKTGGST